MIRLWRTCGEDLNMQHKRKLILEDGSEYTGWGFGARFTRVCEIVFNTSMAGYQEIVSDPSYTDQAHLALGADRERH